MASWGLALPLQDLGQPRRRVEVEVGGHRRRVGIDLDQRDVLVQIARQAERRAAGQGGRAGVVLGADEGEARAARLASRDAGEAGPQRVQGALGLPQSRVEGQRDGGRAPRRGGSRFGFLGHRAKASVCSPGLGSDSSRFGASLGQGPGGCPASPPRGPGLEPACRCQGASFEYGSEASSWRRLPATFRYPRVSRIRGPAKARAGDRRALAGATVSVPCAWTGGARSAGALTGTWARTAGETGNAAVHRVQEVDGLGSSCPTRRDRTGGTRTRTVSPRQAADR